MSHNDSAIKADTPPRPAVSRADFLAALYDRADLALLLEIRCIHPISEKTRVLWTTIGDRQRLAGTLRQADGLNKSGYGVFFAPCLRREKKGSAEAAASVLALWVDVDCDDDPAKRSASLEKLHAFDPPPSVIIDSGGGWHAYWLLDQPFELRDDAARQHIASILYGLFAAVGGDEDYARSVASLMRMPNTVNTKPERRGWWQRSSSSIRSGATRWPRLNGWRSNRADRMANCRRDSQGTVTPHCHRSRWIT